MNNYDDILYLKHDIKRNRMPLDERASIFSPFSALSGYNDIINETERIVESKIIVEEDKKEILEKRLEEVKNKLPCNVDIMYFIKDKTKDGGRYTNKEIIITKIDYFNKVIITQNKDKIAIDDIKELEKTSS